MTLLSPKNNESRRSSKRGSLREKQKDRMPMEGKKNNKKFIIILPRGTRTIGNIYWRSTVIKATHQSLTKDTRYTTTANLSLIFFLPTSSLHNRRICPGAVSTSPVTARAGSRASKVPVTIAK